MSSIYQNQRALLQRLLAKKSIELEKILKVRVSKIDEAKEAQADLTWAIILIRRAIEGLKK